MGGYKGRRALITGGLGFIGSSLARRLVDERAEVTLVDSLIPEYGGNLFNVAGIRDRVRLNISDVRDPYSMAYLVRDQDVVFNLAGQTSHRDSMIEPRTDLVINAEAQLSILEACRKSNPAVKIVFASTRQVYGKPEYLPIDERHPVRPVDVNGINKLAGESYHLLYNNVYGIRACALRLTNTYGPGMRVKDARQSFLGLWVRLLVDGRNIEVFGDGTQRRDFNFVDDCVDALLAAGASDTANGKIYNLGSAEVVSLAELARLMVELAGEGHFELVAFPPDRKVIDIGDYCGDYSLIRGELGWEPRVRLREGLAKTLGYYRQHGTAYWDRDA